MVAKTSEDRCLRKTWRKTKLLLALLVFGAIVFSAMPAGATHAHSVVAFTDKKTYMGWWVDPTKNGVGYTYAGEDTAPLDIYVYAMVLNEKGLIIKGEEALLSGFVADYKRLAPGKSDTAHHIENFGQTIFGNQTLTFKDDGSLSGDVAGDGIYVAKVTLDKTKGATLVADHMVMNVTVSYPGMSSSTQQILISGFYCMNGKQSGAGHAQHTSQTGTSANCAVCHHGYEHWFENVSGTFQDSQLDIHMFKANVPDYDGTTTNPFDSNRWNWSDDAGVNDRTTYDSQVNGSKYCAFCHNAAGSATYDYGAGDRTNMNDRPSCNNSNCHTTTEIANTTVPSWTQAAMPNVPSTTTRAAYNISNSVKHAHDTVGADTVPCVSCHRTTHSLELPNRTSTDYTDLANRCLSCHTLFNKHNGSVSCIKCHNNDTHNIRFLQKDLSYNWSTTNIVTCDNCHTNASFATGSLGLNPPQVPYTNHSGDADAGQKWGDYWTSDNQEAAAGGSNLIQSSTLVVSSQSVQYGSASPLSGAQTVDGSYETLTEGTKPVSPIDNYAYVGSTSANLGTVLNFSYMQSANSQNATLREGIAGTIIIRPNTTAGDTTTDSLNGILYDDSVSENPDTLSAVSTTDNVYTVDAAKVMFLDKFNTSKIPVGATITSATLHLEYGIEDGYAPATASVRWSRQGGALNSTGITPDETALTSGWSGDTTYDLYAQGIDTISEITDLNIEFTSSDTGGADAIHFDYVWFEVTYTGGSPNYYEMNIEANIDVPYADTNYLEIRYYRDNNDTYDLYVYNGSKWNDRGDLTATTMSVLNYTLTNEEYNNGGIENANGSVSVRFVDKNQTPNGTSQGNLYIDYVRVHYRLGDTSHQEIYLDHNFTGIPKYAASETSEYTLTVKGYVSASESLDIYAYDYTIGSYQLVKAKAFPTTNDWVNWSIPYTAISDSGNASIRFRDANRSRYDSAANNFWLDYVAIKADNYKYLPCYYCHALLANHLPRALGNIERVQSGPGGNNPKNSTSLGTSYWCANCHYNGSSESGSYRYNGSAWSPAPPLVNINNVNPSNPNFGSWYQHSVASNFTDAKCKECHGTSAAIKTTKDFPHAVEVGSSGGANCTACHNAGGTAGTGRLVNFTAMNDTNAIHKNLNSGASTSLPAENKKCWACHGNGSEPASGHPENYTKPFKCVDCHVQGASQNFKYTPSNTLLNVTQHYWNGSNITTSNATSCYACHNKSEMMLGASLDPDGAAGVYSGANGGSNSTSHYGKKRADMVSMDSTTYCYYCHNTTTNNATFYVGDFNNTIFNHSARGTTPLCSNCHASGRLHNSTLAKPTSNDTYCSTCHGTGGSAATKDKSRHKALNCTECHANNTVGMLAGKDIHAIKYLTQSNTYSTSNSSAVNCTTCHQTTNVDSSLTGFTAFKIQTPMRHSNNNSNGSVWDGYWTNTTPQTACIYCHSSTLHNTTPLGRILQWAPNYQMYGAISATNTSCGDCHYKGDGNYTQMNSTFVSAGLKTPPEITNGTDWKGNSSNYYNHSLDTYYDQDCKNCHGSLLSGSANMSESMHNVAIGVAGGANCIQCHDKGGTAGSGKLVNFSAINDSNSIHKNLNSGATTSLPAENKKCWACHGNGSEPGGHPSNYKTPYNCTSCHIQGAGQNLNFTPVSILNVSQHYWNGTSVSTANAASCYVCHNKTEMMVGMSLDPDGAGTGIYGGTNGGNNSVNHYGKKRSDMAALANTTYCNYCHNNASSVFPFINASNNRTIANHSLTYPATNPECKECHSYGRLHNSTIKRPAFALPNSSYCLTCHSSGGSATIKNLEQHNGTSPTALNCTNCHLNSTKSIHPARYLQQNSAWDTSKTNAVNCTTCHQGSGLSGFGTAPITPKPMNHSTNIYSGALWNNTQPAFWTNTSQQSSCDYCHGKIALHNSSGLGNITKVKGNNQVKQALENSTWCANCHYSGATSYGGTLFSLEPPEITNASGKVPQKARDNTNFYNHSQDMVTGYNDSKCKSCHNNALDAGATSLNFSHNLAPGGGGANCTSCHYIGGSVQNINISALNDASSIHKDLNKDATATDNGYNDSKKCWACHGNGQEPSGHPTRYKTPYNCTDCHVSGTQNFNYTPNTTILNVTQHYWNGSNIKTPAATSCYSCHNTSGMIISAFDPDGKSSNVYGGANGGNDSVSHYGKKRSDMAVQQNTTPYCDNCHSGASNFPFINDSNRTIANHSLNYLATNPVCKDCHSGGRIHNSTLYKPSDPVGNKTYCLSCHGNDGAGSTNYSGAVTSYKEPHNNSKCTECHLNSSQSIHPVRYLQLDGSTWTTSKTNAVNCTTCHQGTGLTTNFSTAPIIPTPMNHSTNPYSGALWNGMQIGFWDNTSQQTSCNYCHGKIALHNASGLGNITIVKGTNAVRQGFTGGYWCANCHYAGAANYAGTQFSSKPPEVLNASGLVPAIAKDGTQFYNHSGDLASGYDDAKCKTCHNNNLGASATSLNFTHSLGTGGGGANCTSCHGLAGTLSDGKRINQTAMNSSIHKDLNKDASATDANYSESKKCWACHGDGTEPSGHPSRYRTPYNCVNCHTQDAGQNFNYAPNNTILNVTQHYWNGTSINTTSASTCYICHNKSEMMVGPAFDPDGAGTIYSGANGGNLSVSHYGKRRSDMAVLDNTTYCNYCHNNQSSVFPFTSSSNKTISNHSVNYAATNPVCRDCHEAGRLHNDTLYKPAFALPNSTYCLSCHGSGGSASRKNFERHNGTTGLNCTQCHLNSTESIHPVRYLQQNITWDTTNSSAVNCTSCHQGSGLGGSFSSAPLIQTPIWHSNNTYSGALWNTTPGYWINTSQQSSCDYCHGKIALHNDSGLGKSNLVQGTNLKNQSLTGGYWCANCHYNGSPASGNYNYKGDLLYPIPPEILNLTGLVPANSSDGTPIQNHSLNLVGDTSDNRCKSCHGKDLPDSITSATFLHKLNKSAPDAGGPDCLKCHPSTANEPDGPPSNKRINATAFTNFSVHKNVNSYASSSVTLSDNSSKACWACHGDGTQPVKHPTGYTNPKPCDYCHRNGVTESSLFNAPNVGKHYPGSEFATGKIHSNNFTEGSCQVCHNNSIAYNNITANINATVSHYANRTGLLQTNTNYSCQDCHISATPQYGIPKQLVSGLKHSMNTACQGPCHNPNYVNSSNPNPVNLHNASLGIWYDGCYKGGCHYVPSGPTRGGR